MNEDRGRRDQSQSETQRQTDRDRQRYICFRVSEDLQNHVNTPHEERLLAFPFR